MPNSKSAKKFMITSSARNLKNRSEKARLNTSEKKFHAKLEEKDVAGAAEQLKEVSSLLDKAAKHKTIHSNKAERKKSRLTQALNKAQG